MDWSSFKFMDMKFLKSKSPSKHGGIWFISAVVEGYCTVSFRCDKIPGNENLFKCATHNEAKFAVE